MAADDPDRSRLIDAYRRANAAPPVRREQVLERLMGGGDVAVFVGAPRPVAVWPVVVLAVAAAVIAVLALEAITGGVAARLGRVEHYEAVDAAEAVRTGALASEGVVTQRSATTPSIVPAELPTVPTTTPVVDPTSWANVPVQRPRQTDASIAPAPVVATPTVPTELALMDEARRAMQRRGWVDARDALTQHAALYPDGGSAEERRALLVILACRLDPSDDTRARAREYIVHNGRSPFLRPVIGACRPANAAAISSPFD